MLCNVYPRARKARAYKEDVFDPDALLDGDVGDLLHGDAVVEVAEVLPVHRYLQDMYGINIVGYPRFANFVSPQNMAAFDTPSKEEKKS